jgi:hypothetical protein
MSERMVLDVPEDLAQQARATAGHRRVEEVLVSWLRRGAAEPDVESLPDADLLRWCEATLDSASQDALSDLLAQQREGTLSAPDEPQLERLLGEYRRGLVRKARAWREAVKRGLKPSLADNAA